MTTAQIAPNLGPNPTEICGYVIDSALSPAQTYLAIGPGGRGIVLKKLEADCLLGGLLHPSIRERLCRVRELAHAGVANLHGVGREGEHAWLIWEYVPGQTCAQYIIAEDRKPRDLLVLARELILGVESLHMQGIIHGAISGSNVIVTPDGSIRLTHISPLLYSDMAVDVEAVIALLEQAVERRGEQGSPLGQLMADAASKHVPLDRTVPRGNERSAGAAATREQMPMPLRLLGAKVAALLDARDPRSQPQTEVRERHLRRRTLVSITIIILLGLLLGLTMWRAMDTGSDLHGLFRWFPGPTVGK